MSVWKKFSNARGAYSSLGHVGGHRRRLREHDGMQFTELGNRVLAGSVACAIVLR